MVEILYLTKLFKLRSGKKQIGGNAKSYDKISDKYDVISGIYKKHKEEARPDHYYIGLQKMLKGGEDPLYICKKSSISAAEDIGVANHSHLQ